MITLDLIKNSINFKNYTKSLKNFEISINSFFLDIDENEEDLKEIDSFLFKFTHGNNYNQPINLDKNDEILIRELIKNSNNSLLTAFLYYIISNTNKENDIDNFLRSSYIASKDLINSFSISDGFLPCVSLDFFIDEIIKIKIEKNIKINFIKFCLNELEKIEKENIYKVRSSLKIMKVLFENKLIKVKNIIEIGENLLTEIKGKLFSDLIPLEIYEELIELLILISNNSEFKKILSNLLFDNKELFNFTVKQEKLEKAIKYLPNDIEFDILNSYKIELEKANKETLSILKPINIKLQPKQINLENEIRKKIFLKYQKLTNTQRFLHLLTDIKIIKYNDLKEINDYKNKLSTLSELFPIQHLDRDGKIIKNENYSKEKQKFLNDSVLSFDIILHTHYKNIIDAFFYYFQWDNDVEDLINLIFINNEICENQRSEYIKKIIKGILNKEFDICLRNIIAEIEAGLRYFLNKNSISTIEFIGKGKQILIDLNDILKDNEDNNYRKFLLKYLNEDYLFILEYLCILNPVGNIRNDAMHGNLLPAECFTYKSIYLMILLIKLYYGFYLLKFE